MSMRKTNIALKQLLRSVRVWKKLSQQGGLPGAPQRINLLLILKKK